MDKRIKELFDQSISELKSDLKILKTEINRVNNNNTWAGHLAALLTAERVLEHELKELKNHTGWIWKMINRSHEEIVNDMMKNNFKRDE